MVISEQEEEEYQVLADMGKQKEQIKRYIAMIKKERYKAILGREQRKSEEVNKRQKIKYRLIQENKNKSRDRYNNDEERRRYRAKGKDAVRVKKVEVISRTEKMTNKR